MTRIMGIVNVTPDSFFSESRVENGKQLVNRIDSMLSEGAHMIDIGSCSTRPGSDPVSQELELERLSWAMPIIKEHFPTLPLSLDTFRPEVALHCIECWGEMVINDISGGSAEMFRTIAGLSVPYILTFNSRRANKGVGSGTGIVSKMKDFFTDKLEQLTSLGVRVKDQIILDPGFGFSKTLEENYELFNNLNQVQQFGLPVLVGISRKSMIYKPLNTTPEDCLEATTALHTLCALQGIDWLRVHDISPARHAMAIASLLNNQRGLEV